MHKECEIFQHENHFPKQNPQKAKSKLLLVGEFQHPNEKNETPIASMGQYIFT